MSWLLEVQCRELLSLIAYVVGGIGLLFHLIFFWVSSLSTLTIHQNFFSWHTLQDFSVFKSAFDSEIQLQLTFSTLLPLVLDALMKALSADLFLWCFYLVLTDSTSGASDLCKPSCCLLFLLLLFYFFWKGGPGSFSGLPPPWTSSRLPLGPTSLCLLQTFSKLLHPLLSSSKHPLQPFSGPPPWPVSQPNTSPHPWLLQPQLATWVAWF